MFPWRIRRRREGQRRGRRRGRRRSVGEQNVRNHIRLVGGGWQRFPLVQGRKRVRVVCELVADQVESGKEPHRRRILAIVVGSRGLQLVRRGRREGDGEGELDGG